jgi:hypothetical protein
MGGVAREEAIARAHRAFDQIVAGITTDAPEGP